MHNLILTGATPQQNKPVRVCQNHQKILKQARGCVQLNYELELARHLLTLTNDEFQTNKNKIT